MGSVPWALDRERDNSRLEELEKMENNIGLYKSNKSTKNLLALIKKEREEIMGRLR